MAARYYTFPKDRSVPFVPFAWSGLQELAIFKNPSEGPVCTTSYPRCQWTPLLRRLVNESYDIFCSVQERCSVTSDPVAKLGVIQESSKKYRVCIHSQIVHQTKKLTSGQRTKDILRHEEKLLSTWELVWHLCEILYMENLPAGCLIQQLLEWVKWHSHHMDGLLIAVTGKWDAHPKYWTAVFGLVFQGRMKEACKLLENNSRRRDHRDVFSRMIGLLEHCPVTKSLARVTYQELVRIYSEWKLECKRRIGDFIDNNMLTDLCSLLSGDESAFNRIVHSCPDVFTYWYQRLVAHILFTDPLVEASDYLISHLAEVHFTTSPKGEVDKMILAAIQEDIIELIKLSSSSFSNWWFVAHLTDLLHHQKTLEASQIQHGAMQREFLLLEYASSLVNHSSLWQLGVEYLAHCPTHGRSMLAILIDRIPLDSEKKAHKVLHICDQFKLKDQAQSVCRVLATRALKTARMGTALEWAVGSKDAGLIRHITEQYMMDYESVGRMKDLKVLRSVEEDVFLSTDLAFLGRYCDFVTLFEQERYEEAGSLLVELLTVDVVPRRFWLTLLTDALPLLDLTELGALSSEQTETLNACLMDLADSRDVVFSKEAENQFGVIKLALGHNLSISSS